MPWPLLRIRAFALAGPVRDCGERRRRRATQEQVWRSKKSRIRMACSRSRCNVAKNVFTNGSIQTAIKKIRNQGTAIRRRHQAVSHQPCFHASLSHATGSEAARSAPANSRNRILAACSAANASVLTLVIGFGLQLSVNPAVRNHG